MGSDQIQWSQQALVAALIGLIVEAVFVISITLAQPPFVTPPMGAVQYFILIVTFGALCLPLVYWGRAAGYAGSIGVGAFSLLTLVLIFLGALGDRPIGANPLGPVVFAVLSLALIVFGIAAWRGERQ